MTHTLRLDTLYFEKIKEGRKTVEMRRFDEKRQKIAVGDTLLFADRADPTHILETRVVALHRFRDFAELYRAIPHTALGYGEGEPADPADMEAYYSKEEQEKYGVVGIEIARIKE